MTGTMAFSPDGKVLASVSSENELEHEEVRLWDALTQKQRGSAIPAPSYVNFLQFSPDGRTLAIGPEFDTAVVWDLATSKRILSRIRGSAFVAFTREGRNLVTNGPAKTEQRGVVQLWDLKTGVEVGSPAESGCGEIVRMIPLRDGRRAVMICRGSWVIWDLATGLPVGTPLQARIQAATLSADEQHLTVASESRDYGWNFGKALALHGHDLMRAVCTAVTPGSISRLTAEELTASPLLDAKRDRDACGIH